MLRRKVKIKFHRSKINVPIIQFQLQDGSSYYGIVDTGSESTVLSSRMVNLDLAMFEIQDKMDMSFIDVSGRIPTTIHLASSVFYFNKQKCLISGIVADLDKLNESIHDLCDKDIYISAVFGCDTFKQLNAIIDFKEQAINLNL